MKPVLIKYIRLSQEDDQPGESNSVKNQRDLLDSYIAATPSLAGYEVRELCDDGYSGTNFDRPAMRRLLELVQDHQVQCVIVKDYSRFGRNYIESGNYLEQIFPCFGVRFISVNDRFDSGGLGSLDGGLDMAFKNLIHDLYSRDLSEKVRSARVTKALQGVFTSSRAIYGYTKTPGKKNRLAVDEPAAAVVRSIFEEAGAGAPAVEIARRLNDREIPTPMAYQGRTAKNQFWTKDAVTRILRDERYMGNLVSGKRKRLLGKGKTVKVERKDWITVPDTHEPIVSKEQFARAQAGMRAMRSIDRGQTQKARDRPLTGRMFCGHCGYAMRRKEADAPYYACVSGRYSGKVTCTPAPIPEATLEEVVLAVAKQFLRLLTDRRALEESRNQEARRRIVEKSKELQALEKQCGVCRNAKLLLYEGYKSGKYTKEAYLSQKERNSLRETTALERLGVLKQELEALELEQPTVGICQDKLSRPLTEALLERAWLYGEGRMELALPLSKNK